jgi:hypothetical protein
MKLESDWFTSGDKAQCFGLERKSLHLLSSNMNSGVES